MTERRMRHLVLKLLEPIGAFPVENTVASGCPDICTALGWIELKVAKRPAKDTTPVKIDLRRQQRIWLRRWTELEQKSWVLIWINGLWLLYYGHIAAEKLGKISFWQLFDEAKDSWGLPPTRESLIKALTNLY